MTASSRFRSIRQYFYINDVDNTEWKQFAARTYVPGPNLLYIAFHGTDQTLIGWKENFNMTSTASVPA